jgi:hypothetical protein
MEREGRPSPLTTPPSSRNVDQIQVPHIPYILCDPDTHYVEVVGDSRAIVQPRLTHHCRTRCTGHGPALRRGADDTKYAVPTTAVKEGRALAIMVTVGNGDPGDMSPSLEHRTPNKWWCSGPDVASGAELHQGATPPTPGWFFRTAPILECVYRNRSDWAQATAKTTGAQLCAASQILMAMGSQMPS